MNSYVIAYLALAVWFFAADMLAGELAGVKARPWAGAALAAIWPLSAPLAICASAVIIRRLRTTGNDGAGHGGAE